MEKWTEVCKGIIPQKNYAVTLSNGEEGLIIKLERDQTLVTIDFGLVSAVRMFDEGIVMQGVLGDEELNKYKPDHFKNTIYQLTDAEFEKSVKKISGGLYDMLELTHYLIVTMNYDIEIIARMEPSITVVTDES